MDKSPGNKYKKNYSNFPLAENSFFKDIKIN